MAKTKGSFRDLLREKGTAPAQPETTLVRGQGFAITDAAPPDDVMLPLDAETQLGSELYQIARHYLGARRRMGAALLDMVRTLLHARQIADEGTWYIFLELTYTKPDMAELLLNIARRAEENAGYADAIVRGHFNQTVAGELARPSTPPAVIAQLLTTTEPPRVADVKRARREYRLYQRPASANVIPNNSGSLETDQHDPIIVELPPAPVVDWPTLVQQSSQYHQQIRAVLTVIEAAGTTDAPDVAELFDTLIADLQHLRDQLREY